MIMKQQQKPTPKASEEKADSIAIKSIYMVPIFTQGEFWGVVTLEDQTHDRYFRKDCLDLLQTFARLVAFTCIRMDAERAARHSRVFSRAVIDTAQCLRDQSESTHCTLCVDACPIPALFISPTTGQIRLRKTSCIGCGQCESQCPTRPRAIAVAPYTPPVDPIIA